MSRYVLVHGAWHGGWCWERVAPLLRAAGHSVQTPTLAGLADRAEELTPEIGLEHHVQDTLAALRESAEPAVLVAHSYAGLLAQEAAAREPTLLAELVLLDAWIGPPGSSLLSLAPDWFSEGMRAAAAQAGEGWRVPAPDPLVVGVEDPTDAAWLRERLTDHPLKTFVDERPAGAAQTPAPSRALLADPGPVPFRELAGAMGFPTTQLRGGHDLMVTSHDALARTLMEET